MVKKTYIIDFYGKEYKFSLNSLYGKWGNSLKKIFFLWKSFDIWLIRNVEERNTLKIFKRDLVGLKTIQKSVWNLRYFLKYEINSRIFQDALDIIKFFKIFNYEKKGIVITLSNI